MGCRSIKISVRSGKISIWISNRNKNRLDKPYRSRKYSCGVGAGGFGNLYKGKEDTLGYWELYGTEINRSDSENRWVNSQEVDKTTRRYRWNAVWTDKTNGQWRRSGIFIVNFEHISHLILVFLLLTLSR